jgi:acetolactate synthase I/III small subunit
MHNQTDTSAVIELTLKNHPGALSHVIGLFARRAFNLDAIFCVPMDDGRTSRVYLQVLDEPRVHQVEKQLSKLQDVVSVRHRPDTGKALFERLRGAAS